MKYKLPLLAALAVSAVSSPGRAQPSFSSLETRWLQGPWRSGGDSTLLDDIVSYWENAKDGRRWEIFYFASTVLCRHADQSLRQRGKAMLRELPTRYKLTGPGRQKLTSLGERARDCETSSQASTTLVYRQTPRVREVSGVSASSKMFRDWCGPVAGQVIATTASVPLRAYTRAESLQATRHVRAKLADAVRLLPASVRPQRTPRVVTYGRFVIGTIAGHSPTALDSIGRSLQHAEAFYSRFFNLSVPDTLVLVYLAPEALSFAKLAAGTHGLRLTSSQDMLIGYSALEDHSIVAIIPRLIHGTLKHELLHLLLRRDFPDAPPWLAEGLPALYEVSEPRGADLVGTPNWRISVLAHAQDAAGYRADIATLLRMNATEFEADNYYRDHRGVETAYRDHFFQAVHHAVARYFVLYLQDQSMLARVYSALRQSPLVEQGAATDSLRAVLRALTPAGGPDAATPLLEDFRAWLANQLATAPQRTEDRGCGPSSMGRR